MADTLSHPADLQDLILIEEHEESGVIWYLSFHGPNPEHSDCFRCTNGDEARKLKRQIERWAWIRKTHPSPVAQTTETLQCSR